MFTWVLCSVKGLHQQETPAERIKVSWDQRLEAQRAEERRRIQMRQQALQLHREREQRLKEQEEESNKQEPRSASRSARLKCPDVHLLTCDVVSGRGRRTPILTLTSFPRRLITPTTKVRHQRRGHLYWEQ